MDYSMEASRAKMVELRAKVMASPKACRRYEETTAEINAWVAGRDITPDR